VAARGALLPVGLFSMVFNILALALPIVTMQVYDRMFSGGSLPTLLYLSLAATGVLVVSASLDVARSMVAVRVSRWLEDCIAPQAFAHAIEMALHSRDYTTEALHDLLTLRTFLGGAALFTLFDALWAPVYLAVIFLLHPWVGAVGVMSALILVVLAGLNERMTRPPLYAANSQRLHCMRTAEMTMRNADAVVGMGMTGSVSDRWSADNDRLLDLHLTASRRSTVMIDYQVGPNNDPNRDTRGRRDTGDGDAGLGRRADRRLNHSEPRTRASRAGDWHVAADHRLPHCP
jgi:ABC-type protease/lipase transport system fused ATPase/permease subunit